MNQHLKHALYWILPCLLYLVVVGPAPHWAGSDLQPTPDAQEYALLAIRLAHFQPPLLGIGLYDYPSRYSLAFPALLAPAAALLGFDTTRFYLAAAFFGLAAVALMAHAGARLLGSRAAGGLAAAFFALHPQTVWAATTPMSESAILMVFLISLELAWPWLERGSKNGGIARAALLGLALGWLTLAKAPFACWALALTAFVAARDWNRRAFGPLAALIGTGAALALGDALYRRWAFGGWGTNGYRFWAPAFYTNFSTTFNPAYLWHPSDLRWPAGNLRYYGRMLFGLSHEFYGRFMAPVALVSALGLVWPRRVGRPAWPVAALLAGWGAVGVLFCAFYFYQEPRFPYLWIPLIDLLAAWGLVRVSLSLPRRGGLHRIHARRWVQAAALAVALLLLRGEYRRVRNMIINSPDRDRKPMAETLRPLLAAVPQDAWLFTNFNQLAIETWRPHPGPTGTLYVTEADANWPLLNKHIASIQSLGLKPRRIRPELARELQSEPQAWDNKPAELIGDDGAWKLTPAERRAFFHHPAYILIVRPDELSEQGRAIDQRILPLLRQGLKIEEIQHAGTAALYRAMSGSRPK